MALYGTDQSHWQAIGNYPGDFGIFKATQGINIVDPKCDQHYQAAKAAGKLLGVYHYANFGDAVAEANWYVDNIQGYLTEAVLALDVETTANVEWALAWLNQVYLRTQVRPFVYMSASTATAADWKPVYDAGYALWAAGYPNRFNVLVPPTPEASGSDMPYDTGAWPFATIWQYSSSGGTLDRDIFYGSSDAWHKFALGDHHEAQPPAETQPTPDTPPADTTPVDIPAPGTVVPPAPAPVPEVPQPAPGPTPDPAKGPAGDQPAPVETQPQTPVVTPQPQNLDWWERIPDSVRRVFHTAWQVAIPVFITHLLAAKSSKDLQAAFIAAGAVALAALKASVVGD